MKLVHEELECPIMTDQMLFTEWIIESPDYFSKFLEEFWKQWENGIGRYVLSDGEKELDFRKNVELIFQPLSIDLNDKRILGKLYAELEQLAHTEQLFMRTQEITQYISEYVLDLEQRTEYILQMENTLDMTMVLKSLSVKYEVMEESYLEKLVQYIKITSQLLKKKLYVFVNLRSYLTDEKMNQLIQEMTYQEIHVLFIENQERTCVEGCMRYIIDTDGCEIQ